MRKIPSHLENPFDDILLETADYSVDKLYNAGFTPNGVTTLSLIFGLLSIYFLCIESYMMSSIMYLISYYFDCLDGHLARKYNMISEFGDYYDHIKDYFVGILILIILFKQYYKIDNNSKYLIWILPVIMLTSCVQMGCQEIHNNNDVPVLKIFKKICKATNKEEAEKILKISKYFGCGTLTLVICGLILLLKYLK